MVYHFYVCVTCGVWFPSMKLAAQNMSGTVS